MKVIDFEATVENGGIKLPSESRLPEHTRVRVVIEVGEARPFRFASPRLVDREKVVDFHLEVSPESDDADV